MASASLGVLGFLIGGVLTVAMFLWFALACMQIVSNATVNLYLSCIIGGLLLNSTIPLFYEAAVEVRFQDFEPLTAVADLLYH